MKRERTLILLFVMALVASVATGQMKTSQSGRPTASPTTAPPPTSEVTPTAAVEAGAEPQAEPEAQPASTSAEELARNDGSSTTGDVAPPAETRDSRFLITILVAAIIFLLTVVGFVLQLKRVSRTILAALPRGDEGRLNRDRLLNELALVKNDTRDQIATLRTLVEGIPQKVQQRLPQKSGPEAKQPPMAPPARRHETTEPSRPVEDASAQLLNIANEIVQQTPTTLDAFRASTRQLSVRVSAWPNATDGAPVAFIVEHGSSCYAIPNVIKPARLPQEWFNRSEFGVNDEIQRVVTLPLLRRRGNDYEVAVPGEFTR